MPYDATDYTEPKIVTDPHAELREVLLAARSLLQRGWTQGVYARTRWLGRAVRTGDDRAASFCILGALKRASYGSKISLDRAAGAVRHELGDTALANWNDRPHRKKPEVLALFDRTLENL